MGNYQSITVKTAMSDIANNKYLLPAIQRKFVWEMEQIEMLFDSIMRGYPINSFMFWKVTDKKIKTDYKFYMFIKDFAQRYNENNPYASTAVMENDFYAIVDGQQRMTSLYIGLDGSYREKKRNKHWDNSEEALPTRRLYLELTSKLDAEIDNQKKYNFKFLSADELKSDMEINTSHFWFKVGDILKFASLSDVTEYLLDNNLLYNAFAMKTLSDLFNQINTADLINYYVINDQDQDKVLDVFLRTNSGGTALSFSDLLMSIASANWEKYDAREELSQVKSKINDYGNPNFIVSQDFILKALLVLSDCDVKFNIKNFSRENIADFEDKWEEIKSSLVNTFKLLEDLKFNDTILRAKNAAIPVAYYIYKNKLADKITKTTYDKDDKEKIRKWLSLTLLKGLFGGQSDTILQAMRDEIRDAHGKKIKGFPLKEIANRFKADPDKNYHFDDDVIDAFLEEEYGSPVACILLNLLYPNVVQSYGKEVAQDHMHPKSKFSDNNLKKLGLSADQFEFYKDKKHWNTVLNLQLLESRLNESKSDQDLKGWAEEKKISKDDLYVKSETSLDFEDFEMFINDRREILTEKLKALLEV